MKIQTFTWTEDYKIFEVGEFVMPNSSRCVLAEGVYRVTECVPPMFAGSEAIIFVEGHEMGFNSANFKVATPRDIAFRYEAQEVYNADQT